MRLYGQSPATGLIYVLDCEDGKLRFYSRQNNQWEISSYPLRYMMDAVIYKRELPSYVLPYSDFKPTIRAQMARRF